MIIGVMITEYTTRYTRDTIFIFQALISIQLIWVIDDVIINIFLFEQYSRISVSAIIEIVAVKVIVMYMVIFIKISRGMIF